MLLPVIAQGHLGAYVRSLTLLADSLIIEDDFFSDMETTDASIGWWYSDNSDQTDCLQWRFNEDAMSFITDGSFATFLVQALRKLPNLISVAIEPPHIRPGLKDDKSAELTRRYLIAVKVLLNTILYRGQPLRELVIAARDDCCGPATPVPLSSLDLIGVPSSSIASLEKLYLDLRVDVPTGNRYVSGMPAEVDPN